MSDNLERFHKAQDGEYEIALREIKAGHKRSHWIWYIFPQIAGLGMSETSKYYAIRDIDEAKAYMNDPVLRNRLLEISSALLKLKSNDAEEVMGWPDNLKLRSSMTLFREAAPDESVFQQVLSKFYDGKLDEKTLVLINESDKCQNMNLIE